MNREKAMFLVRVYNYVKISHSISEVVAMSQVITGYLRDKGHDDKKIGECLSYLCLQDSMLIQEITEAIIEYLRREYNICILIRFNPYNLRGKEELLMVF